MTQKTQTRLSRLEFIALMGVIFATVAFSIDAMLPALPDIAQALSPGDPNLAQLVITSFVLGMGIGTFAVGPLSDAFGRKGVIVLAGVLYVIGAVMAWMAQSLEWLLLARLLQGIGAAGPRVVSMAMIRDLYAGRHMAQIISFAMLVFTIFPAIAPSIGAVIIAGFGWRAIFLSFILFAILSLSWLMIRQAETLPPAHRRPLSAKTIWTGLVETLAVRQMQLSILVQALIFGLLFGTLSSIQQIFAERYGQGDHFHLWFALIALLAAPAGPLNGRFVVRIGMRPLIRVSLMVQIICAALMLVVLTTGILGSLEFWAFLIWTATIFGLAGFAIGNLNALALEPLGHIAGMAASVMGALATIAGAALGAAIGQFYDGTAQPLAVASLIIAGLGFAIMRHMPREQV
jgi:DHA1 family bicyclomycin/chloramphenicol resistance-like MFS transporter